MVRWRGAEKFILPHWRTSVIWKCWIGGKTPKIQRSGCTPKWQNERRFRIVCCIYWAGIISITNDSSKNNRYCNNTTRLRRSSSRRSISLYPGNSGRCPKIIENSKVRECPEIWIREPKHKRPKSWSTMEDPVRSSWAKSVRSSCGRIVVRDSLRKLSWNTVGKSSKLWVLIR